MPAPPPPLAFTHDPSTESFTQSPQSYLTNHSDPRHDYIAVAALVFSNPPDSSAPRVLLLQRAASDSMPGKWELPGGGCDEEDESILYAAARELWEETGLKARHINGPVGNGGQARFFTLRSGKRIGQFVFAVDVHAEGEVRLNPEEHQAFVWATEDEVREGKEGDVDLVFTTEEVRTGILEAFGRFGRQ